METSLVVILIGGLLVVNALASFRIARFNGSSRRQKVAQLVLLWLLPFIGAITAFLFTRESLEAGDRTYGKRKSGWDDMMHPGTLNRKGHLSNSSEVDSHDAPD